MHGTTSSLLGRRRRPHGPITWPPDSHTTSTKVPPLTSLSTPFILVTQGSDAYELKEVDDVAFELDAAMIVVSDGDVDIGGNPSAEEQQEALENGAQQVINIVHSFRLQSTSFDKKQYLTHLKVRAGWAAYTLITLSNLSLTFPTHPPLPSHHHRSPT